MTRRNIAAATSDVVVVRDESATRAKLARLHRLLADIPSTVVGYSGGTDSAFLGFMAHQALDREAVAVTADSPSLPRFELRAAREFAEWCGMRHLVVPTNEMDDDRYVRNEGDRCFFCKLALMDVMEAITQVQQRGVLLLGVNTDDLGDHRPGQRAAQQRGARFPLVEVGLTKPEIRWLSKELGLPTWDKPAAACLSSRIAYGVTVTPDALRRIEAAEEALAELGVSGHVRVRDQGGDLARIEVDPERLEMLLAMRTEVVARLKDSGFLYVTLDLEGYRMGSQNEGLRRLPLLMRGASSSGATGEQ